MQSEFVIGFVATFSIILGIKLMYFTDTEKFRQRKLTIFGTKDCEYTQELIETLSKEGKMNDFEYKDLDHEENIEVFKEVGGESTPCIANMETKKAMEGAASYKKILEELD